MKEMTLFLKIASKGMVKIVSGQNFDGKEFKIYESERVDTTYIHGAGCTFSAAITAELAKGKSVLEAIDTAKDFITEAIRHGWKLNEYVGPTMHGAYRLYGAGHLETEQILNS
jgi:pyridoxine kinase